MINKIKEYIVNSIRLLKLLKFPKEKEYFHVLKVCSFGILSIGFIMSLTRFILDFIQILLLKILKK